MTTKPFRMPWADEPFRLIETPSKRMDGTLSHVHCASEMSDIHNTLIRGLNAIMQQAPHVRTSEDRRYKESDVRDLLFFVRSWTKSTSHHHWVEESFIFPRIEEFAGKPGLMDDPRHQHELFHDGLERLAEYTSATAPADYRWEGEDGMRAIIDSFAGHLLDHMYAEIDLFLALGDLDGEGLRCTWVAGGKMAKKNGGLAMLYEILPAVLGCADKTYEGGNEFPPLPRVLPYLVKYWFAARNGAWRFNPCDWWGRPRPLAWYEGCDG